MKKLIIIILTAFTSLASYSQQKTQYIGLPDNTVEVRNKLRIDALKDATGDSVMVVDAGGNVKLKAITDFTGIGGGTSGPDSLYLENPIYSVKEVNTNGDTIQVIKFRADSLPELRYAAAMRDTNNWVGSTLVDVDYLNDRISGWGISQEQTDSAYVTIDSVAGHSDWFVIIHSNRAIPPDTVKLGSDGSSSERFGIEDNTGIQDRNVDMEDHSFSIANFDEFQIYNNSAEIAIRDDGLGKFVNIFGGNADLTTYSNLILKAEGALLVSNDGSDYSNINTLPNRVVFSSQTGTNNLHVETPLANSIQGTFILPLSVNGNYADSTGNITISTGGTYTLPTASATVLGGVKVGSGLAIDGSGVLSATGSGATPPWDQVTAVGDSSSRDVIVNGSNLGIGNNQSRSSGNLAFRGLTHNTGSNNTAFNGLWNNTSGSNNVAIGGAMVSNTTGSSNVAIGTSALNQSNASGNIAIGPQSLVQNTTGNDNIAIGYSLYQNTTGSVNIAIGNSSLSRSKTSSGNVAIGYASLSNSTGSGNTALGNNSSFIVETGQNNTSVGSFSYYGFNPDASSTKTFNYTAISGQNVTIPSHGFGSNGSIVRLLFNQGSSSIPGLLNGSIYQAIIVDANTLYISEITGVGTGTGHTFTRALQLNNTTSLGASAQPTQSNQVVLGDQNVTQVLTYGNVLSKVAIKSTDPTTTDIPTGFTAIYRNSTSGLTYLWANISGTLIKIQLQ